jgi:hypothetical protein
MGEAQFAFKVALTVQGDNPRSAKRTTSVSNEALPNEIPEWREILMRIAAGRGGIQTEMPDEDPARVVLLEVERAGSPVARHYCIAAIIEQSEGSTLSRGILISSQGKVCSWMHELSQRRSAGRLCNISPQIGVISLV